MSGEGGDRTVSRIEAAIDLLVADDQWRAERHRVRPDRPGDHAVVYQRLMEGGGVEMRSCAQRPDPGHRAGLEVVLAVDQRSQSFAQPLTEARSPFEQAF
jgi:hypothetical protein